MKDLALYMSSNAGCRAIPTHEAPDCGMNLICKGIGQLVVDNKLHEQRSTSSETHVISAADLRSPRRE
jgi:hypothetical protein